MDGCRGTAAVSWRWWRDLLYCAVIPLPLLAPSLPLLVVALMLFGMFNGAMDVSMNAHGVAVERLLGRPIMSSLHAMFSIGGILGQGAPWCSCRSA